MECPSGRMGRTPERLAFPDDNCSFHLRISGIGKFIDAGFLAKIIIELCTLHQFSRRELPGVITGCFHDMNGCIIVYPGNHRPGENGQGIWFIPVIPDMDDKVPGR